MNKMYLVLGDWSNDGHGKTNKILVGVSHTVEEVQQAYKDSCKLTGFSFNHNEDYTGIDRDRGEKKNYQLCAEYEDCFMTDEILDILKQFNCPLVEHFDEDNYIDDDMFIDLWMWFVELSLENFKYNVLKDSIPVINGYWSEELNVQFGYGLYG